MAPDNLPTQLTSFVGRKKEIADVRKLLSSARLVTLTGPGGAGKTRLALRVADELSGRFPDGVWFVDLAPLDNANLVTAAVASTLGVLEDPDFPIEATLAVRLHDKQLLLVLDNCEHLTNAVAVLASELLRSCPELRVLATSREPLGIDGETIWDTPPLALPIEEATEPGATVGRHDAVRLFYERAGSADAHFEQTRENAEAVIRICRRMDGLPLGIELAASIVRVLPVEEIADRLDRRLTLPAPERAREPRHRTIDAAIAWSYGLLTPAEQALFRRLSVFSGGFSLEAAQAVCTDALVGHDDLLLPVSGLVDKSLVVRTTGVGGRVRYRLLETILGFASTKLAAAEEAPEIRDRHLRFFASLAADFESNYLADAAGSLDRLEEEHDNFRAALAWAQTADAEQGLRLACGLAGFWHVRRYWAEGRRWLETLIARDTDPARVGSEPLIRLANLEWRQGNYDEALGHLGDAVSAAREIGNSCDTALSLAQLAFTAATLLRVDVARSASAESLTFGRICGNEIVVAQVQHTAAVVEVVDDRQEAQAMVEDVLARWRELGAQGETAYALTFLAWASLTNGDYVRAREAVEESVSIRLKLHDLAGVAVCLAQFSAVAAAETDLARALRLAGAASALRELTGFAEPPHFQRFVRRWIEPLHAEVGSEAATALWAEGRAMTVDESVTYALGRGTAPRKPRSARHDLSRRELEVVELLSSGMTNRQIADKLFLSERTVDAHLERIRNKLGLRTRAAISAWYAQDRAS